MTEVDQINFLVEEFQKRWDSPSISLAVGARGNVVYKDVFEGKDFFADKELVSNYRFRIASVGKIFTSVAINKLIQDGTLSHESLVFGENGILDFGDNRQANLSRITVGHLLTHFSGISGRVFGAEPMNDKVSYIKNILDSNQYGLNFETGSRYEYSNLGYVILSAIVEAIAGEDFEEWVKENIFLPIEVTGIESAASSAIFFNETTNDWRLNTIWISR